MSQLHNFVIKSATGLILGKEQISVVPAKGCRKNLKGQPTMADVLASISERQRFISQFHDSSGLSLRKGGTR